MLLLKLGDVQRATQDDLQLVDLNGLPEEVIGPLANRTQSIFPVLIAGNDNHFGSGIFLEDIAQGPESFLHVSWMRGQTEIERHHRRLLRFENVQGTGTIVRQEHLVILAQGPVHLPANFFVIVHDKQLGIVHSYGISRLRKPDEGCYDLVAGT